MVFKGFLQRKNKEIDRAASIIQSTVLFATKNTLLCSKRMPVSRMIDLHLLVEIVSLRWPRDALSFSYSIEVIV